jgi:hypothetical protein
MELKIENHKNQLLREQNNKIYELELKYKNKERALERQQKAERDSYERAIYNKDKKRFNRSSRMPKSYKVFSCILIFLNKFKFNL